MQNINKRLNSSKFKKYNDRRRSRICRLIRRGEYSRMSSIIYVKYLGEEIDLDKKSCALYNLDGKDIYIFDADDLQYHAEDNRAYNNGIDKDGNYYNVYYHIKDNQYDFDNPDFKLVG